MINPEQEFAAAQTPTKTAPGVSDVSDAAAGAEGGGFSSNPGFATPG